ncbi:hypothetical protein MG599_24050 (plasmid) [Paenarthrobacter sp. SD-1]|uniref:Uncharacterized protein n=1 Tax=Paenarthrobacter ureafaciens TaxID=37931 RepID=A0AAX3ERY0_PAEUR|nr:MULTISPECIES: hypothetical protein [Paenarthrobacter]MDO5878344.1 hypothetical protein [Paenarthrobacter sp. SD-1]UYW00223.1 hypothetical protein NL394_23995 [Paenarthrobacter ureafaciens]
MTTPTVTATATIASNGTVRITDGDGEHELKGKGLEQARQLLIQHFADQANLNGNTGITVDSTDPELGKSRLFIKRDSTVELLPIENAAEPEPAAEGETKPAPGDGHSAKAAPAPAPAPESQPTTRRAARPTAADFAASRPQAAVGPAQEGWQGALNALSGGSLRIAPGDKELQRRSWRASIQRGLAGHKTVVFINLKGGAGKTTKTYLFAAILGRVRGGNILAWDNNENKGTLGDRSMRSNHDHTAIDLLANIDRFATPSNAHELVNYVHAQGENKFHVLASQNTAADKEVVDGAAFTQLHGALKQFYHLMAVDTGNASTAGTWQAAVEIADEIVIVAMNKEDSVKTLASTVDTLVQMGYGDKLANGVLLITQPPVPSKNKAARVQANNERLERTKNHFAHYVRDVVVLPNDEALDDGGDIVYENLAAATQEAYLHAAAAIVEGL